MQREFRKIGEEYRRANTEGFASIVRSRMSTKVCGGLFRK